MSGTVTLLRDDQRLAPLEQLIDALATDAKLAGNGHYGVHLLYKLGLSSRAIGAQMGWSEKAVESLLQVYGHVDLIALSEVDALYAEKLVPLPTS